MKLWIARVYKSGLIGKFSSLSRRIEVDAVGSGSRGSERYGVGVGLCGCQFTSRDDIGRW